MNPPPDAGRTDLTFSREEAWVAHVALLVASEAAVEAGDDSPAQLGPIRSLERGRVLDLSEIELLRDALVDYLGDAPVRDRAPGRALLRRADRLLETRLHNV